MPTHPEREIIQKRSRGSSSEGLHRGLIAARLAYRLTLTGLLATAGNIDIAHASTAETTLSTGIVQVGTSVSPVQSAEVGNASTVGSIIKNLNDEIAARRVSNPTYLSRNTNSGALVMSETDRSAYQGTHGVLPETDIKTVEQSIRTDLATAGVIPPGTDIVNNPIGIDVRFIVNTQDSTVSGQFPRWDQPNQFISIGVQAVDGFVVPVSPISRITNLKDQVARDVLRIPPAHYANIIPSTFTIGSQMDNLINTGLKTAQVQTDAKVKGLSINSGLVETGSGGISLNHASLLTFRQYLNTTHNLAEISAQSYHLPAHFKNTRFRLHPVLGTTSTITINQTNRTTNADISYTTIEAFIPTATTGKSGKVLNNAVARTMAVAGAPIGSEMFDVLANGSIDPRVSIAYIVIDRGLTTQKQGIFTANQADYIYRVNVDQATSQAPSEAETYIRFYSSTDTVSTANYLDSDYLINTMTTASTPLPTITPTLTVTSTPTVTSTSTETPTSTPTQTETATNTITATATPTATETQTITSTATSTVTETPTTQPPFGGGFPFPPANLTSTPTETETVTATSTATFTETQTTTSTATSTVTETPTTQPPFGGGFPFPPANLTSTPTETETVTPTPTKTTVNKLYFPEVGNKSKIGTNFDFALNQIIVNVRRFFKI